MESNPEIPDQNNFSPHFSCNKPGISKSSLTPSYNKKCISGLMDYYLGDVPLKINSYLMSVYEQLDKNT